VDEGGIELICNRKGDNSLQMIDALGQEINTVHGAVEIFPSYSRIVHRHGASLDQRG